MSLNRRLWRQSGQAYLFLLPAAVLFLVFTFVPILLDFGLSFFKWSAIEPPRLIGLSNWRNLLSDDVFLGSILTTFEFTLLNTAMTVVIAIGLALLVDTIRTGRTLFRSFYFTPVVTSAVAMSFIIKAMFKSESGIINYLLSIVGIHGPGWLVVPTASLFSVALFTVWLGVGSSMLIFLAGLQSIPDSLQEAASMDGANWLQRLFRVMLPMLTPATFFVVVISVISNLQLFDTVYTLTRGGPGYATVTMVYNIYTSAYVSFSMGYASSQSIVLFVVIMIFTLIQWRYQDRWVHYE